MKRKARALKNAQLELMALIDFILAEAYEAQKDFHYRLSFPYGAEKQVRYVVDLSVYYDGELSDESGTKFKVSGPRKKRH